MRQRAGQAPDFDPRPEWLMLRPQSESWSRPRWVRQTFAPSSGRRERSFVGRSAWLSLAVVCGSAVPVWAQEITEPAGKSYTLMYLLVILSIALGLLGIMRPSRRAKQQRPQRDD